nr:hypothetical protein [Tanacetum cinerariifolium]
MSLHGYSDVEYDDGSDVDNVTLISKLDVSHPLHLHPNDYVVLTVVSMKLKGTKNNQVWSCAMLLALKGKNKSEFINGSCRSYILSRETLPDVRSAYTIISNEESQRIATEVSNTTSFSRPSNNRKPNDNGNRRTAGGSTLVIYSKDVMFFEDIFPFKQNSSTGIDKSVQDVNHLNFLNFNTLDDLSEIPNDEERRNLSPIRHCNSPSHSSSTFAFFNENDAGHSQDADASVSENESFAADENKSSSSEGNDLHGQTQDNVSQHKHWVDAMNAEMDALYRNNTWKIIDLPVGRKAVGSKWVWKSKYKSDGEIERYKARLVAKGFNQREPNISLICEPSNTDPLLDNVTEYQNLIGKLIYLTTTRPDIAYTVSCLSQFMYNPLKSHLKTALKVIKYLKGSPVKVSIKHQALPQPLIHLHEAMCKEDFIDPFSDVESKVTDGILLRKAIARIDLGLSFLKEMVNSMFFYSGLSQGFWGEAMLTACYLLNKMDVKTSFLNGKLEEEVYMNQPQGFIMPGNEKKVNLTKEFLSSRFSTKDMGEADGILGIRIKYESNVVAISQSHYIEKKLMPNNGQVVSQHEYSRVIGCLMYVMTCTRPGIAFAVGKLSGYTSNLGTQHWQATQGISNTKDNSSNSGWVFLLSGGAISWASKKQTCISGSTMEYEFVALVATASIFIRCDTAATLAKAYSQMYNGKSRHLGVRHSMIRELITNGVVFKWVEGFNS